MELKNVSNYPVTVNGVRIETGETRDVEIEDGKYYENDRRFKLEEDDNSEPEPEEESEDDGEEESDDEVTSKSEEQKTDNTGD